MSAPQTNLDTQKRRHRGPLIGMALVAIFGVLLIVIWLMDESAAVNNPGSPETPATSAPTASPTPPANASAP